MSRIIEKGCPAGWCKLKISDDELLKNEKGAAAVIPVEAAQLRCFTGNYSPVLMADCHTKAAPHEKEN